MILLFRHGWGFDASFWSTLAAQLPAWRAVCDDRGYFGAPDAPDMAEPHIVVAHSFGAMRALSQPVAECRGLIAINGFDRFTPGISPRIVDRMVAKFDSEPAQVLADFRRRCGDDAAFGPANVARLREDLLTLRDGDCTATSANWPVPILSLQGAQDPLLPPPMRDEAFGTAPLLERMTHPTGGHLLPATDAPWCARAIAAFAERLA